MPLACAFVDAVFRHPLPLSRTASLHRRPLCAAPPCRIGVLSVMGCLAALEAYPYWAVLLRWGLSASIRIDRLLTSLLKDGRSGSLGRPPSRARIR